MIFNFSNSEHRSNYLSDDGVLNINFDNPQSLIYKDIEIMNGGYDLKRIIGSYNLYKMKSCVFDVYDAQHIYSIQGFDNLEFVEKKHANIILRTYSDKFINISFPKLRVNHLNSIFIIHYPKSNNKKIYNKDLTGLEMIKSKVLFDEFKFKFNPKFHDSVDAYQILDNYEGTHYFKKAFNFLLRKYPKVIPWDYIELNHPELLKRVSHGTKNRYVPSVIKSNNNIIMDGIYGEV